MADYPKRGDIYWIRLDPTIGTEIQKTRPCLILSNNSQNKKGMRVIAAPITSRVKNVYPFEAKIILKGRECKALLDQLRALDNQRIGSKIASVDLQTMFKIEEALRIAIRRFFCKKKNFLKFPLLGETLDTKGSTEKLDLNSRE